MGDIADNVENPLAHLKAQLKLEDRFKVKTDGGPSHSRFAFLPVAARLRCLLRGVDIPVCRLDNRVENFACASRAVYPISAGDKFF
jgi:hypothetical protein